MWAETWRWLRLLLWLLAAVFLAYLVVTLGTETFMRRP